MKKRVIFAEKERGQKMIKKVIKKVKKRAFFVFNPKSDTLFVTKFEKNTIFLFFREKKKPAIKRSFLVFFGNVQKCPKWPKRLILYRHFRRDFFFKKVSFFGLFAKCEKVAFFDRVFITKFQKKTKKNPLFSLLFFV